MTVRRAFGFGLATLALFALALFALRYGPLGLRLPAVGSVAALGQVSLGRNGQLALAAVAILLVVTVARGRLPGLSDHAGTLLIAVIAVIGLSLTFSLGHLVLYLASALALATLLAVQGDLERSRASAAREGQKRGLVTPVVLFLVVAGAHATFAMHRHWAFGSGSWDLGCMIHNFYRASRGLDTASTVLGEVDFLGDHFMVGIYLLAPFFWLDASGYMVLAVQSASLAASAPAIYGIALARGASPMLAAALGLATGLGFGMQSGAFFDAHEITVGLGFLAAALWAIETGRLRLATLLLVVFSTFKESLGAYVVGLGLLLVLRALTAGSRAEVGGEGSPAPRRLLAYGAGWIIYGAAWFVAVNRVLKPFFAQRARPLVSHETFGDFGPTVFAALVGMLADPLKAVGAIFVPAEKTLSLGVTFGGTGALALLAPEVGVAALPLLAERFLSSKATMWQMGYHYAAPLTLYAGWAAALAIPRAGRLVRRLLEAVAPGQGRAAARALAVYVLLSAATVNHWGYRHPANFHVWREPYFSTPAKRRDNARAVAFVRALGRDVSVAAQNRILPHLADRPGIWRLGEHERADVVVVSLGENAWPYADAYPGQIARRLMAASEWRLVFVEGTSLVFARGALGLEPVAPPPELAPRGA